MLKWHNERRKVSELIPYEGNPRQITEKQAEDLKKSLERFDLVEIPAIDTDNKIVAGHQRLKIMQSLGRGEEEIDVRVPSRKLTDKEFREYNLRSNKNTGEWDWDALANFEILELKEAGFSQEELDKMILNYGADEKDDVIPESVPAKAKLGEIYQLGNHKIMCGDSTKKEDVERLMDGKKADMVFTDPPYGINLDTDWTGMEDGWSSPSLSKNNKYTPVINDATPYDVGHIFRDFGYCEEIFIWGGNYLADKMPSRTDCGWFVWDKTDAGRVKTVGHEFEILWSKHKHKGIIIRYEWAGINGLSKQDQKKRIHPTQKPLQVCEPIISKYSKADNIIVDLFLGSGSTLIAAEKTGRICYGMELEPKYIDVIIKRWEDYTNQEAVLISQGEHGETRESLRSGAEIG